MIGLLIITHETIGEAYRGLTDHFFPNGFPENLHILGVQPDEDQNERENKSAILTGLNAPMMIKAIQYSSQAENLSDFTETVKEAAIRGIFAITSAPEDLVCKENG